MSENPGVPPGVDPTKPNPARIYDYVLGGTYNFPVDREAAERIRAQSPDLKDAAWVNRAFHQRAARWMAAEQDAHVVYVDNDPMVRAYAGEFLSGNGTTAVITADVRAPDSILNAPALRDLIDCRTSPTKDCRRAWSRKACRCTSKPMASTRGSREQIGRFFTGLELVSPYPGAEPAVTHIGLWGADAPELADSDGSHGWFGGVAHRP